VAHALNVSGQGTSQAAAFHLLKLLGSASNGGNGATLAASRRLEHWQLSADTGRSGSGNRTGGFDPHRTLNSTSRSSAICPEAAIPRFLLTQPSMAQGGHSLLSAAVVIVGFNTREPVLLIRAFVRELVGMSRNFVSGKTCATAAAHCAVFASGLLRFAGDVGLYDMGRDCRGALQIWKLLLLAMNFSMSGAAAARSSRLQPLGPPFGARMSIRCIMPISS